LDQLRSVLFSLHRGTPSHGEWVVAFLSGAWPRLLGDRLAAACRPARFENSKLVVEVIDSNWAEAVKSIRSELLEKLRAATAGEVKSISVCSRQSAAGSDDYCYK
jgi:hypothetical protein